MKTDRSVIDYFEAANILADELASSIKQYLIEGETLEVTQDPTSFLGGYEVRVKGEGYGYGAYMKVDLAALNETQDITDWFKRQLIRVRQDCRHERD